MMLDRSCHAAGSFSSEISSAANQIAVLQFDSDDGAALDQLGDDGKGAKISQPSEGAANFVPGRDKVAPAHPDLDEAGADAHLSHNDNDNDGDDAMPIETTDWRTRKNFWQVRGVYMKDRHGDVDRDLEAHAVALGDGHSHEEILDAACAMTFTAIGKGGVYPHIPPLAKFLTSLPPPVSNNVVALR